MNPVELDEAAVALGFISADCNRETWLHMGMALKNEYGDVAFSVWDNWSSTADSYKPNDANTVWKSIKENGGISIATLIFQAKQNGYTPEHIDLTPAQKQKQAKELAERKAARKVAAEKEAELTEQWHNKIALLSLALYENHISSSGSSPYLGKKKIRAFGVGFFSHGVIVEVNELTGDARFTTGQTEINAFFEGYKKDKDSYKEKGGWFLYLKKGVIAVPVRDETGRLFNLQFIFEDGGKKFIKKGRTSGCFHLIAASEGSGWLLVTEGYATAASLHMATGDNVVVAFNAGNLLAVSKSLSATNESANTLICGDNDVNTEGNPGKAKAMQAAKAINARWCIPDFEAKYE